MAQESLDEHIKRINKEYGEGVIAYDRKYAELARIPFSSPRGNYALYGGIPRGRIVEFYGPNQGGKTTSALDIAGNAQKLFDREFRARKDKKVKKQKVLVIDAENTLDKLWSSKLGVNWKDMVVVIPSNMYAEQIFDETIKLIYTGEIGLVILDSLAMLQSKDAFDKDVEEKTFAGISGCLSRFSPKLQDACTQMNCTFIGINQVRQNMNSTWGGYNTPGGEMWKHVCSVRINFRKGKYLDNKYAELTLGASNPVGNNVEMVIEKTKICPPDRRLTTMTLHYYYGIDFAYDTLDMAIQFGIVTAKGGGYMSAPNPKTGEVPWVVGDVEVKTQGRANFLALLMQLNVFEDVRDAVNKVLSKTEE